MTSAMRWFTFTTARHCRYCTKRSCVFNENENICDLLSKQASVFIGQQEQVMRRKKGGAFISQKLGSVVCISHFYRQYFRPFQPPLFFASKERKEKRKKKYSFQKNGMTLNDYNVLEHLSLRSYLISKAKIVLPECMMCECYIKIPSYNKLILL